MRDVTKLQIKLNCFRWVLAVDMYEKVAKTIAPKRESLQKAESDYQAITIFILLKAILKTAFTSIHPPHPSIQDSKFLTAPSS